MEVEVRQRIEQYKREAESQECPECCCPHCRQMPPGYRRHAARKRQFYVIAGNWAHRFFTVLIRWKCLLCGVTFTFYPSFCMPYKRFVLADITRLSGSYVEADEATYRSVVGIGHRDELPLEKQVSHSTVWHWLSDLGTWKARLQEGLRLLQEKDPGLGVHRQIRPVAARKYRSEWRREQLYTARFLLRIADAFSRIFGQVLFPRLRNTSS